MPAKLINSGCGDGPPNDPASLDQGIADALGEKVATVMADQGTN
jgi:hypothetical protein